MDTGNNLACKSSSIDSRTQFWSREIVAQTLVMDALYTTVCPVMVAVSISLETVWTVGLTAPKSLLLRADEVTQP
jgi:hypothetical protein